MAFRTNKTRELYIAYVLDEEVLRQLQQILHNEVSQEVRWYVSLADGSSLYSTQLADLLEFPNANKRTITGIRCKADSRESPGAERTEVEVKFRNYGVVIGIGSIVYEVTGDDRAVVYLSDKLEEFLLSQRQWYTILLRTISSFFVEVSCMMIIVQLFNRKWLIASNHNYIFGIVTVELAFIMGLYISWYYLRNYLFPVCFFVLGKGKQRYQSIVQMRFVFGGSFLLALVVGVIVSRLAG